MLTKQKALKNNVLLLSIISDLKNIDSCPKCKTPVTKVPHPFNKQAEALLFIPILIFLAGLILQNGIVLGLGVGTFILTAIYILKNINTKKYKTWRYFREYATKI